MTKISRLAVWILVGALGVAFAVACGGGGDGGDAQAAGDMADDPDVAPAGASTGLPEGYMVRLDRDNAAVEDFHVTTTADGLHVQTGPAGVLYQPSAALGDGDYSVSATFIELEAPPNHREAFGLIFGGRDLAGTSQAYSYFLVRADGSYLIKRRMGGQTSNVTDGWLASDAVARAAGDGPVTNALSVMVEGDSVHFMINGTLVATLPASELDVQGVVGVRVNHNLSVEIRDWSVSM